MMRNTKKQCGHLRCGATCRFGPKLKKKYALKRSPLKKKFYRIPKVSEKRKTENEKYFKLRQVFLKEHPRCECGRPGCRRKSTEIHHSAGRSGSNFLDVSTWRAVARVCHRWAEENPEAAKLAGVSKNRISSAGRKIQTGPVDAGKAARSPKLPP